jgi:hypothetical protein
MFFVAVALAAVLTATVMEPSPLSLKIAATITMLTLLAATIAAATWRKPARWFWFGYALSGWGYIAIAFMGGSVGNDVLVTRYVSTLLDRMLKVSKPKTTPSGETVMLRGTEVRVSSGRTSQKLSIREAQAQGYTKYAYSEVTLPSLNAFLKICDCAWSILLACLGGWLAYWLTKTSTVEPIACSHL